MIYLGDFPTGATVYVPFHTFNAAGASVTLTGLAVTDIEVYKDGSVTQRASDAGYTLLDTDGIDFDSLTGLHGFKIDLSDNTDAGFYAAGSEYMIAVSAVTVDSQTVSFWAATFSIERAGGALALLKNATYGLSAIETLVDDLESRLTAARAGYLDNINNAALATIAVQSGDAFARLGAPAGASVSADVAAVKAQTAAIEVDTQDLQTQVGTDGAGLTALPWNAAWDTEVQSEVADALAVYDPPTNAEMEARTLTAASYFDPATDAVLLHPTQGAVEFGQIKITANVASQGALHIQNTGASSSGAYIRGANVGQLNWGDGSYGQSNYGGTQNVSGVDPAGIRSAVGLAASNLDTQLAAIVDDTGTSGVVVAAGSKSGYALTSTEHTNIADAILKRDWSAVTGEASRSLLNALRFLRNKWSVSGATLTVTKEDDATSAWTATLSTDAGADPITGSDPA